ncbi:alpha/beta-hydrolase [Melanomma pulvis-pyrius CBS 109.77]|uniref:Alpha/beta-hydrolase n=1 Tax=Melanomma pulvis-pyrius CBS 109.77 TaxID=1314802 RepID=A0A6A6WVN2_9PLEO|nr:alpha/beta-hydrolase [Melanomma pulvis-pyrius CBS 109.77]
MSLKPTFILVPGSFSPIELYTTVVSALASKGYPIHALPLVTVGKKPGIPPSMHDDALLISQTATKYADEGKDVILIAHSYGGIPTTEAMKGVTKKEREKEGKKGGVVRLAYMAALVPSVGTSAGGLMASVNPPEQYILPDADGWLYQAQPEVTAAIVFNDLSVEDGIAWVKKFPQHSAVSFGDELAYAGYRDVPVSYLFCENDKCVPPEVQQKGIETIEEASGEKVDVTRINSGHCPMISAPDKVVEWFVRLAEK